MRLLFGSRTVAGHVWVLKLYEFENKRPTGAVRFLTQPTLVAPANWAMKPWAMTNTALATLQCTRTPVGQTCGAQVGFVSLEKLSEGGSSTASASSQLRSEGYAIASDYAGADVVVDQHLRLPELGQEESLCISARRWP